MDGDLVPDALDVGDADVMEADEFMCDLIPELEVESWRRTIVVGVDEYDIRFATQRFHNSDKGINVVGIAMEILYALVSNSIKWSVDVHSDHVRDSHFAHVGSMPRAQFDVGGRSGR